MTKSIVVREIKAADIRQIIELIREFAEFEKLSAWCEVTGEDLHEAIFGSESFVQGLVAESENALAGYALFFPIFKSFRGERSMFLEDLYITPLMRGHGMGFAMLKEVARIAKEQKCERLDWQALKWNDAAINFYKNLGAEANDESLDFRLRGAAFENFAGN